MAKHKLLDKLNLFIAIVADPALGSTTKIVAACLLLFFHNTLTGLCFPSNRTVGRLIGLSPENVSRHINKLIKADYLRVRRRFATSNSYDFNWSRGTAQAVATIRRSLKRLSPKEHELDSTKMSGGIDENEMGPCQNEQDDNDEIDNLIQEDNTGIEDGNLTLLRENDCIPTNKSRKEPKSSSNVPEAVFEPFFAQFLSIYPLESSEGEVPAIRAAARRALALTDTETILNGAMLYHTECAGREANFIADPVNWLNGRRWTARGKTKTKATILGAHGEPLPPAPSRSSTVRDRIQNWQPASRTKSQQ